jgi:hypothetical protein
MMQNTLPPDRSFSHLSQSKIQNFYSLSGLTFTLPGFRSRVLSLVPICPQLSVGTREGRGGRLHTRRLLRNYLRAARV